MSNKLTPRSTVSFQWYAVKNTANIIENFKKLLVAITFFLSSQSVNESSVQWDVGMIGSSQCDALRDLVAFVQFENREKHPWRSVNFSKVAGWSTNATKSRNASQISEKLRQLGVISTK